MSVRSVRPVSAWDMVLTRPARPAPFYIWPLALLLAFIGGQMLTDIKTGVLLFGAIAVILSLRAVLAQPLNGFLIAFCIFPEYTVFRGICGIYKIPLPLALIGMWPEIILTVMMMSLICFSVARGARLRLTWYDLPASLLLASGVYGLTLSILQQDTMATVYGFHGSITPFCFYFLARWLHHRPEDFARIARYWLYGFALLALFSIFDFIVRPDFFIRIAIEVRQDFWGKFEPHTFFRWYPRMQSLMFAEQTWGTVCGLVSLFCIARVGQPAFAVRSDIFWRRTLWVIFGLAMFGLVFSMSRGAHACWLVACFVLFLFRGGHRRILAITTIVSIGAIICAFALFGGEERVNWLVRRTASLADSKSDLAYERVNQWVRVLRVFPLFPAGRGLGKAGGYAMQHGTGDGFDFVPDGGYFKIIAEQGIPGIALFMIGSGGVILVLTRINYRMARTGRPISTSQADDRAFSLAVMPFFCGLLVQNIGGNIFDAYYLPSLFWMLVGLVVGRYTAGVSWNPPKNIWYNSPDTPMADPVFSLEKPDVPRKTLGDRRA